MFSVSDSLLPTGGVLLFIMSGLLMMYVFCGGSECSGIKFPGSLGCCSGISDELSVTREPCCCCCCAAAAVAVIDDDAVAVVVADYGSC